MSRSHESQHEIIPSLETVLSSVKSCFATGSPSLQKRCEIAKKVLEAAVKIGVPQKLGGVAESIEKPEFATAVGLAMLAAESAELTATPSKKSHKKPKKSSGTSPFGFIKKIFNKF